MGTILKFITAFHPTTDSQTERTIQTLEDLLRACIMDFGGTWDEHLKYIEFSYNNSHHVASGCRLMKHCMGENIEVLFVGVMSISL